ncbi:globin domain-containing protein [Streptomyces sp. KR80]|uniref:globin domain-containing protein n=1 Tax=Streptomyces sp. KR80 TaxID=3457426 RepID=UPI003FD3626E
MDAPTTTSADNGDSDANSGDWGWFTPSPGRKSAGSEDDQEQADRIPSRPVSRIRPVGQRGSDRRPAPEAPAAGAEAAVSGPGDDDHQNSAEERVPRQAVRHETGPGPAGSAAHGAQRSAAATDRLAAQDDVDIRVPPYVRAGIPNNAPETGTSEPLSPGKPASSEGTALHQGFAPADDHAPAAGRTAATPDDGATDSAHLSRRPAGGSDTQRQARPGGGDAEAAPSGPAGGAPPPADGAATAQPPVTDAATTPAATGTSEAPARDEPASPDAILIRRTMAEIDSIADKVTSYFYALLFVRHPDLRALFPAAMDTQRDRLFKALLTAAEHVDDAETLTAYLQNLGRGHRKYGTLPEHYPAVGECLLAALARYAPDSWGAETEAAWVRAYTAISQIMIDAAADDARRAPAWWDAEVVAHDSRTSDIAVITLRPDQPYPFKAGQYATVETPWWPRVWRHYSFASAPRSDGLLTFHVRAVPAGWVSNALVHRARPGDIVRLGPPGGSMTVDHSTDNGLLCLGGGTGIAPIKALVEDVAEHGRKRPVDVFYGARSDHDLYDIDTMLGLEKAHSWLSVRPVVSGGPAKGAISGPLPDAVLQYGPWNSYDAYLSGPPGMIRSGVDTLVGIGIPSHRIRHDSLEELVAAGPVDSAGG